MATSFALCTNATTTASTTLLGLISAATVQPAIYDVLMSSNATPASHVAQFQWKRFTAVGTKSALTPVDIGPHDLTALSAGAISYSGEPTYTSNKTLLQLSINQQATYRWVAAPDKYLIAPSTASAGIGWFCAGTDSAFSADLTEYFYE